MSDKTGVLLLDIAHALGLSQAAVARHLGISKSQVGRWHIGSRPMPAKYLVSVCQLLDYQQQHGVPADTFTQLQALNQKLDAHITAYRGEVEAYVARGAALRAGRAIQ